MCKPLGSLKWNLLVEGMNRSGSRGECGDAKDVDDCIISVMRRFIVPTISDSKSTKRYGHVVRRDDESILKKAVMFEVYGPRKRGRPKQTWKKQVEENIKKIGLRVEEATDRARWREGVGAIAEGMRCIRPPSDTRKNRIKPH